VKVPLALRQQGGLRSSHSSSLPQLSSTCLPPIHSLELLTGIAVLMSSFTQSLASDAFAVDGGESDMMLGSLDVLGNEDQVIRRSSLCNTRVSHFRHPG
jgi:hypothetical protein